VDSYYRPVALVKPAFREIFVSGSIGDGFLRRGAMLVSTRATPEKTGAGPFGGRDRVGQKNDDETRC
jgi:hypothetical protein